jgi:hypothetical protein
MVARDRVTAALTSGLRAAAATLFREKEGDEKGVGGDRSVQRQREGTEPSTAGTGF